MCVCVWDGGGRRGLSWNNTTQPSALFVMESVLRVSMATPSLGNAPSLSRWGDDAAACLWQIYCSPLCELTHSLFPSDGAQQKYHALSQNKMHPNSCRETQFTHLLSLNPRTNWSTNAKTLMAWLFWEAACITEVAAKSFSRAWNSFKVSRCKLWMCVSSHL